MRARSRFVRLALSLGLSRLALLPLSFLFFCASVFNFSFSFMRFYSCPLFQLVSCRALVFCVPLSVVLGRFRHHTSYALDFCSALAAFVLFASLFIFCPPSSSSYVSPSLADARSCLASVANLCYRCQHVMPLLFTLLPFLISVSSLNPFSLLPFAVPFFPFPSFFSPSTLIGI